MSLSRDDVVAAAMSILDTYGLADLTMRRLATTLGVQAGALYWHFTNKQTLLAALADTILADLPAPAGGDWAAAVQSWAARLHTLLRRHRSGAELVSSVLALRPWDDSPARGVENLLVSAGVGADTARAAAAGVLHLVLGHTMDEEQTAQLVELGVRKDAPQDASALLDEAVALLILGVASATR